MKEQIPEAVNRVTMGGNSLLGASIAWAWIRNNSEQITVIFGAIGLVVTIYGVFRRPRK